MPFTREEILRSALLVPCESREALSRWIRTYLDIFLPDCIVDPDSNSTPLDLVWESYSLMMRGGDPALTQYLYWASRDSFKTLGFAILQTLAVLHLDSDVVHIAAQLRQGGKAASYVKRNFERPFLSECKVPPYNIQELHISHWRARGQRSVTHAEAKGMEPTVRGVYDKLEHYLKILPATVNACNSEHCLLMLVDEYELVEDAQAIREMRLIPTEFKGRRPLSVYTSSRKFAAGHVQQMIDTAPKTGVQLRHYNILDITERCPPERHRPDLPRLKVWRSDELLEMTTPEQYGLMAPERQEKFVEAEVHAGCASCELYPACRGNLVNQVSKSPLLRSIPFVISQFKSNDLITAQSQLLCRKPSTKGLIYPQLDPQRHRLSLQRMAEMVSGEDQPENLSLDQLIEIFRSVDAQFVAGMDFGQIDPWAVVLGVKLGERLFIFRAIEASGVDPEQQIDHARNLILPFNPRIWPDMSGTDMIRMFRKAQFRMVSWKKGAGSLLGGIQIVRARIAPTIGKPLVYFLAGDEGVERLFEHLSRYRWKNDSAGEPVEIPDDHDDHLPDAFRYLVQNVFDRAGGVVTGHQPAAPMQLGQHPPAALAAELPPAGGIPQGWMRDLIDKAIDDAGGEDRPKKKGGIIWSI